MSLTPTDEQSAIIHWQGQKLVVNVFAGTGKTSTLVQYALTNPDSRMLYLAYNRSVRDEAERKFPFNVECKTSHQLAWSRFGRHYQNRLVASLRITDVARKLNTRHWLLVRLALSSLNQFLCSADKEPGPQHLPDEDAWAGAGTDVSAILQAVQVLWHEMSRPDGAFPVTDDTYLKLFQLSFPDLSRRWDTILFDEAQDANPVTSALVFSQSCRVILVGDRYQQIYRFRGADNALSHPVLNDVGRLWLTQSFRFGSSVARMANLLLQRAGEKRQVTGSGGEDDVLMSRTDADKPEGHRTVLSRTVAGVICTALMASLSGRKVYWVGGIEGYRTEALEDLYWFSADMPEKMQSDALRRDYRDFDEYCRIAKSTRDVEMNQAIRLLDICFPLPVKLKLLREHTVTCEKDADITVSTPHRSKGLEWPVVILDEDFADITDPLMPEDERRDETNLLYVAVTRARKTLVLNSLMRQLAEEAGRDEQSQKATEASPSENGENDAVYGQEGENA
ncbi:ATP-dependent helicase [Escherichia marmotae]|uniref:ATP-dependent helicase n=5 Tax=Escherichia TaxID=561 RepID=A0ABU1C2G9_9ESCH|nr:MULTISPECIES: UvrD-helicase domain-containing protein [Escherichia]MCE2417984.1 ATP-dependent helicase [Escherichia coli]MCO1154157.1 UvrD-helicase domain-containing protein [Escherichia coli]MDQ9213543.1 ATP-dependent helicase [Escherichia marmotae]MDQ9227565.1 ATP-dependent helicase [Escherichia marmotae]MDQ9232714.1 ATP-dependent helicase [Escherichia marmotae]